MLCSQELSKNWAKISAHIIYFAKSHCVSGADGKGENEINTERTEYVWNRISFALSVTLTQRLTPL